MRTVRRNKSSNAYAVPAVPVKMKLVEVLEARTSTLCVNEVVEITGLSRSKVYQKIAQGELPSLRIDGTIKVDPNQLIEWWKQRQTGLMPLAAASNESISHKTPTSVGERLERAVGS